MPTQIASTPIVSGKAAKKIIKQLKKSSDKKTECGLNYLKSMFEEKEK